MSETTEAEPRKVRIGLLPVLVLITLIVGGGIWLALSQNAGPSAAPAPTESSAAPALTQTAPSTSPSPSASPTERPLLTADEFLTANLGRGYELRDDAGNPADLCSASRFIAPYNLDAGAPSGRTFDRETVEGFIRVTPVTNDSNGYFGIIDADC
ncbi:hypothetical protein [Microbacterium sp. MRS-1]|uniref:hypothetical protein n=1 Tax=Microbacterium sp. MRS-1 TaxID=1451261 RepID=UPI0004488209|nr:hypothetical protein [Microbacterium sp. MRS-1]EXJ50757.1 hypothetical protein AS96_13030 [Microbacterium sp. MRS-1]